MTTRNDLPRAAGLAAGITATLLGLACGGGGSTGGPTGSWAGMGGVTRTASPASNRTCLANDAVFIS